MKQDIEIQIKSSGQRPAQQLRRICGALELLLPEEEIIKYLTEYNYEEQSNQLH